MSAYVHVQVKLCVLLAGKAGPATLQKVHRENPAHEYIIMDSKELTCAKNAAMQLCATT